MLKYFGVEHGKTLYISNIFLPYYHHQQKKNQSPINLLLRVRQLDGRSLQGSIQLHSASPRSASADDVQRLLRQDGATLADA